MDLLIAYSDGACPKRMRRVKEREYNQAGSRPAQQSVLLVACLPIPELKKGADRAQDDAASSHTRVCHVFSAALRPTHEYCRAPATGSLHNATPLTKGHRQHQSNLFVAQIRPHLDKETSNLAMALPGDCAQSLPLFLQPCTRTATLCGYHVHGIDDIVPYRSVERVGA